MRLAMIGESLIERIIARMNMAPTPMVETQIAFSMARSIMAGVKLGIYDAIGRGATTATEVAAVCNTDREATTKLLNTLVGCRYLRHREGHYRLTPKAQKWLLQSSPHSIADKLLFQYDEWDIVAKYEDYVTTGRPLDIHGSLTDTSAWNRYQRGMRALASISAEEVADRLPVPAGATTMLDIGGSHGYYSVCACRRHAGLRSTILDLPQAVEHAAPILAQEGMGERVAHRAGNALSDELGNDAWDVVFLSQLVHHFTDEQNRELMRRIARALKPGGVCVLLDTVRPSSPEGAGGIGAVLDLYFAATSRSGTWPLATMQAWQRDAGLAVEKPIHLRTLPGCAMVIGRKSLARGA
ncbi:MAG: class I SAM-dependent methyltransferase [Planctomycetia bacterium]|nr:class I SAM-dependent methyltransferase [Planctomycetia bacterium]